MANRRTSILALIQARFLHSSTVLLSQLPSTTNSAPSVSSFTVQFLTNSCGLSLQSARSASQKLQSISRTQIHENNLQSPQSVLDFLKSYGFNDAHIAKLVEKQPDLLHCKVEDNLKPKFDFFIQNGFVGQLLPELIASHPGMLRRSLESHIKPSFEFLKSFLHSNEKLLRALNRSSWLLTFNLKTNMKPNVDLLIKEGVPADGVAKLILWQPRGVQQNKDRMVYAVNVAKKLGLEPEAPMFVHALRSILSMTESNWKKKIEMLKSVGWSEEEVLGAFKRYPDMLSCSEVKFRRLMDFFVNTLKLEKQAIIANPRLLKCAFDKRIRPRCNVLKVLESEKLINGDKKIPNFLLMSEKKFMKDYITKYADKFLGLLEIYRGVNKTKG